MINSYLSIPIYHSHFFFALFVVVAVVVFQGLMIALGDFSAYNNTEVCINKLKGWMELNKGNFEMISNSP